DSRAAYDGVGPSIYWPAMLSQMEGLSPELILHVGDLVKNGRDEMEWVSYLNQLPQTTPLIAVRGNHDRGDFFYKWGFGVAEVFKLDIGAARIFGLDSEGGRAEVMARLPELERLLAEPTERWKIVYLHRPIWSQGLHGSDELGLNEALVTLFDRHHVVLVLSGHDHNYERFCPMRGTSISRACRPYKEGTTYVVTGGGATMPNPFPAIWRRYDERARVLADTSLSFSGDLHFLELDVTASNLTFRAHASHFSSLKSTSSVFDMFSIEREVPSCP
ncbi:MAG: metallophosphoesterase family protein, partial [Bradymonadia bacterium]